MKQQSTPCLKHEHVICKRCDEVIKKGRCCQVVNEFMEEKTSTNQQRETYDYSDCLVCGRGGGNDVVSKQ